MTTSADQRPPAVRLISQFNPVQVEKNVLLAYTVMYVKHHARPTAISEMLAEQSTPRKSRHNITLYDY